MASLIYLGSYANRLDPSKTSPVAHSGIRFANENR